MFVSNLILEQAYLISMGFDCYNDRYTDYYEDPLEFSRACMYVDILVFGGFDD